MTQAEYKVAWNEGYDARYNFLSSVCPYKAERLADAWWDGFERAMEDEGVFVD